MKSNYGKILERRSFVFMVVDVKLVITGISKYCHIGLYGLHQKDKMKPVEEIIMGHMIKEKPEMLAKVNAAIQRIAKESGSDIIKNLVAVQIESARQSDYLFGGTIDVWSTPVISGMEIGTMSAEQFQPLIKCRIENSMLSMIDLLEDELEKLKK